MSSHPADFLVEIGTEELPAQTLNDLARAFSLGIAQGLQRATLEHQGIRTFATPRRLAVFILALDTQQQPRINERKGPTYQAAFHADGTPTKAGLKFAQSCGVTMQSLTKVNTEKGQWLCFTEQLPGKETRTLLPTIVQQALSELPIHKPMRWGSHKTSFIRPVHWVVMILGTQVIPCNILGQEAGNLTYGHRFHHPQGLVLTTAADYATTLKEQGYVLAEFAERKAVIQQQITLAAQQYGQTLIDEALLQDVTGIVEWPIALLGHFSADFLTVPHEALICALRTHQKCFAVVNAKGELQPYFVAVSNIDSREPTQVISGNERVIRARLSDAQFFYQQDRVTRLEERLLRLKDVVFQHKLGSLHDKAQRISQLAVHIARQLDLNPEHAARAGLLCKADLTSAMVGEFPELQGTMGYYYALQDHEVTPVAEAIKEHYFPRFASDTIPNTLLGCVIALADKLDTLSGIFAINQAPSSARDPFALRRAALGVLRILIEQKLPLDLESLLLAASEQYTASFPYPPYSEKLLTFIRDRLRHFYSEQGVRTEVIQAVLATNPTKPLDIQQRILALQPFLLRFEAEALIVANKRVSNILKKHPQDLPGHSLATVLLSPGAEQRLYQQLLHVEQQVQQALIEGNYSAALNELALLQEPIEDFFNTVRVMTDNVAVQNNRLILLQRLRNLFLAIADFSLLSSDH